MKLNVPAVKKCLKSFDLKNLFREHIGWDNHQFTLDIALDGKTYSLHAIAQKRGFVAFECSTIPDRSIRLKIDRQVTKSAREHIIVYSDKSSGEQVWQWVRREPGKPLASRDHRYSVSQSGDPLVQRLEQLAVGLDEEEQITVVEVASRARAAFNVEKVTKQFYDRFKTEHALLLSCIAGFPPPTIVIKDGKKQQEPHPDLQWYTSLMLNRLMFVYFIQKKGFLDGDTDYLRNRMNRTQQERGKDKFVTFYRYFLLRLFHEGLGQDKPHRDPALERLLGTVPYLNGGFFEVHQLEERYPEIEIPDKSFEKLFNFFDLYRWHLDERPLRQDNEINPDVVGYIFEKYINQKQMGAYYTKEDITEYISKYTIIPFLFDAAEKKCQIAFKPNGYLWRLLKEDADRYLYPAVKHGVIDAEGVVTPLPKEIQAGVKDVSNREDWNKPAPEPFALPTETWREYIARRTRCLELRENLKNGQVHSINDLVTLNLDIWQFARDAITSSEGPELLRAFWAAIEKLTVLDPTCGSGAFLFAALRILESLYSDCLERMEQFVAEQPTNDRHPEKFSDFKMALEQIEKHPSQQYFILKSIIINNLFGVDIMEEAVEICKLRLFLKLISQVELVTQIEPLPDVDFNIRAGNTLVGYARRDEVENNLNFGDAITRIIQMASAFDVLYQKFRKRQLADPHLSNNDAARQFKQQMRGPLERARGELDNFMAISYGAADQKHYEPWRKSHQPFHWMVEFYGIMMDGGFDVIVGNPPYVEYRNVCNQYKIPPSRYITESCGNLLAYVSERSVKLAHARGRIGLILLVSTFSTERMSPLQDLLRTRCETLWVSNFAWRPSKLFSGANTINAILLAQIGMGDQRRMFSTKYNKWTNEERPHLFAALFYGNANAMSFVTSGCFPKVSGLADEAILQKIFRHDGRLLDLFDGSNSKNRLYYFRGMLYWIKVLDRLPVHKEDGKAVVSGQCKTVIIRSDVPATAVIAMMSSSMFFWFYQTFSDCQQINRREFQAFRVGGDAKTFKMLGDLGHRLMQDYRLNSRVVVRQNKARGVTVQKEYFTINKSKAIIDQIDEVLGKMFGLSSDEIDTIQNYDIKYRVGADDEDEA